MGELLHEEILITSREKNRRSFLENPEWGVGATTTRGRLPMPYWCQFCGSGDYTCLGGACMGPRPSATLNNFFYDQIPSHGTCRRIPGLVFKDSSSVNARRPGMKKGISIMRTAQVKKFRKFSGVCRDKKIPFPACFGSVRRVKHKVHFHFLNLYDNYDFQKRRKTKKVDRSAQIKITKKEWIKILMRKKSVAPSRHHKAASGSTVNRGSSVTKFRSIDHKHPPPSEIPCPRKNTKNKLRRIIKQENLDAPDEKSEADKQGFIVCLDPKLPKPDWMLVTALQVPPLCVRPVMADIKEVNRI